MNAAAEPKKYEYIDSLRGIAILCVVMLHSMSMIPTEISKATIRNIIQSGVYGVHLFFIVSAFTLFASMNSRFGSEKFPVRNFFIRRFFRLAPVYYVAMIYTLLEMKFLIKSFFMMSPGNIISHALFLNAFHPYWINSYVSGSWSTGNEAIFYMVLPLLFCWVKNIRQAISLFVVSLIVRIALYVVLVRFNPVNPDVPFFYSWASFLTLYFPNQLPVFSMGIVLYFIIIKREKIPEYSGKIMMIIALLFLFELASGKIILRRFFMEYSIVPHHILFGFAFSIFIIALSRFPLKLFVNPVLSHIGKVSFSMYLFHFTIFNWLGRFNFLKYVQNDNINYIIRFFLVTALSIAVSTITYQFIELPFQKLGKKIIAKLEITPLMQKRAST